MAHRFQQGSLSFVKNKTAPGTWYFRWYEDSEGSRVYRKQRIGTVLEYPRRRDAEMAVHALRAKINAQARCPETVADLLTHYKKNELIEASGKRSSTREVYGNFIRLHIEPRWGRAKLHEVKTFDVENWLRSLPYAPATRTKIKTIMSAVFAHGKRHGMIGSNPIEGVRTSSKRLRNPDVLTPSEFSALLDELPQRERVMVLLAGSTGLRRSELIALRWDDVDFSLLQVEVLRSCVRSQIGDTKTAGSSKPVPLHSSVAQALTEWRETTEYPTGGDFLFPSLKKDGAIPLLPDMVLRKTIRPAAHRAGIHKRIGWHTFRHSLGTNLRALGVDVKVAQELLRHANVRITLDLYTQALSSQKREANARVMELLLPAPSNPQHPLAPSALSEVAV